MKRINLCEELYLTDRQKELDDLMFNLSTGRYDHLINGLLVVALKDDECEELIKKISEFLDCADKMDRRAYGRVSWDSTVDDYVLVIDDEKEPGDIFCKGEQNYE